MPSDFDTFITALELRHFQPDELLYATDNPGNSMPPSRIWGNIVPTILILDELRATLGRPIRITSCYRNPIYNARIGGATLSQHTAFTAIDFHVRDMAPLEVKEILISWRDSDRAFLLPVDVHRTPVEVEAGIIGHHPIEIKHHSDGQKTFCFSGGIGIYRSFNHLDTRGTNHVWYGAGMGTRSA
jgi:hypothetical protein